MLFGLISSKTNDSIESKRFYKKMCDEEPCKKYITSMIDFRNDTVILIDQGYFTTYQIGTYYLDEEENIIECHFHKTVSFGGNSSYKSCNNIDTKINFRLFEKTISTKNRFEGLFGNENEIEIFIIEEEALKFYDLNNESECCKLSISEYTIDEIYKDPDRAFQECEK